MKKIPSSGRAVLQAWFFPNAGQLRLTLCSVPSAHVVGGVPCGAMPSWRAEAPYCRCAVQPGGWAHHHGGSCHLTFYGGVCCEGALRTGFLPWPSHDSRCASWHHLSNSSCMTCAAVVAQPWYHCSMLCRLHDNRVALCQSNWACLSLRPT